MRYLFLAGFGLHSLGGRKTARVGAGGGAGMVVVVGPTYYRTLATIRYMVAVFE